MRGKEWEGRGKEWEGGERGGAANGCEGEGRNGREGRRVREEGKGKTFFLYL